MNILVLSWRDPKHPLAGGAEQVMQEHMKGWVKDGNTVTLFSSRVKGLPDREVLNGVEIIRKGDQFLGVKAAAFLYYLKNKRKIDLVVDQFHGIPFFTPLYVKCPKLAVLQEVTREVWFLYHLIPFPFSYLLGLVGYLTEPLIFTLYKRVPFMVGSASAKEDLTEMRIPAKNITVVPHGVLVYPLKPIPQKEKVKTVIFLGALAKDKGIEDAIRAFAIINSQPGFQFWVVGRGVPEYQRELRQLCQKLGLATKVKFWGFVEEKQKFELLARAHVLVNPSVREGWGLVNIEANAMGTPVVAYRSSGLIDSVKDNFSGVIVDINSPEELAKTVIDVLADDRRLAQLQKGAGEWSKNFTWERSKRLSLELINGMMTK